MLKNIFKGLVIILMLIGIGYGISITVKREIPEKNSKMAQIRIYDKIQTKTAELTSFYTYGRTFNISGKISNISKDNLEGAKLVITDGIEYEESYQLNYDFQDTNVVFSSDKEINKGIILDNLKEGEYFLLLRLSLNNSVEPRFYSFSNSSNYQNIDYYTVTKENSNKKAEIYFYDKNYEGKDYKLSSIKIESATLPEDVYDIVIDAGHGGKDVGERSDSVTEADLTLEYAKLLKENLESSGYKVKLTRDDSNTDSFTYTNMYDSDGRISIACRSRAKLMISFHVNNGANNLSGFEIYSPCKSNLVFIAEMANKINEKCSITFSNNNSFKNTNGVYVRGFTKSEIKSLENTAKKKGYEPYTITQDTPYQYTIREVGGIATGAYADGRNKDYNKNEYYNSNHGIECYQIELGYIKNDLEIIKNEKENYISAISETIHNNY